MVQPAAHLSDPAVVVVNPDDTVTAETFATWLERSQGDQPADPGIVAADTLHQVRATGEA